MVRIDMSEYMEKFSVSRLIGAPPGYVGYEEGGQLSERVRRKPYCVVLLDEIEKAHPDIFNLLLQVMDEGRLTDSNGRMVDFKNTIVIMTSNVGSREMEEYGSGIGFATAGKNVKADRKSVVEKAVKKAFPPEFINRVDAQVYFNSLDKEAIEKIIDIELKGLKARVQEAGYKLTITPTAKRFIADMTPPMAPVLSEGPSCATWKTLCLSLSLPTAHFLPVKPGPMSSKPSNSSCLTTRNLPRWFPPKVR